CGLSLRHEPAALLLAAVRMDPDFRHRCRGLAIALRTVRHAGRAVHLEDRSRVRWPENGLDRDRAVRLLPDEPVLLTRGEDVLPALAAGLGNRMANPPAQPSGRHARVSRRLDRRIGRWITHALLLSLRLGGDACLAAD